MKKRVLAMLLGSFGLLCRIAAVSAQEPALPSTYNFSLIQGGQPVCQVTLNRTNDLLSGNASCAAMPVAGLVLHHGDVLILAATGGSNGGREDAVYVDLKTQTLKAASYNGNSLAGSSGTIQ